MMASRRRSIWTNSRYCSCSPWPGITWASSLRTSDRFGGNGIFEFAVVFFQSQLTGEQVQVLRVLQERYTLMQQHLKYLQQQRQIQMVSAAGCSIKIENISVQFYILKGWCWFGIVPFYTGPVLYFQFFISVLHFPVLYFQKFLEVKTLPRGEMHILAAGSAEEGCKFISGG